jgi:hypothetical protein
VVMPVRTWVLLAIVLVIFLGLTRFRKNIKRIVHRLTKDH